MKKYRKVLIMKTCYVDFGAYGIIDEFEVTENMTEEEITAMVEECVKEFASSEVGWTIEDNEDE